MSDKVSFSMIFRRFKSRERIQNELESESIRLNNGVCDSYNICKYCKENKDYIIHKSSTPCADALFDMEKKENKYIKLELKTLDNKYESISTPVSQYSLNGNYINSYKSMREAERITNIDKSQISDCCKGKFKQAGGYIWKKN